MWEPTLSEDKSWQEFLQHLLFLTAILESLGLRVVCFRHEEVICRFGSIRTQIQALYLLPEEAPL